MPQKTRSQLIAEHGLRNVQMRFSYPNDNFLLAAEVVTKHHCDALYAARAIKNPREHTAVLLTWRNDTISDAPRDFRLWLYPDFSLTSEYREVLTREEVELRARILHVNDNNAEYLFNQETGPVCPDSSNHVLHDVKRDLASRISMLYDQGILTMCNLSSIQDPNT